MMNAVFTFWFVLYIDILHRYTLSCLLISVSGGPNGARDGTLTIMCGGNEQEYVKYSPLLSTMGSNVMYFGSTGSGTAAKLVNQCLVTTHAQAAVEAIHMAESFNLIDLGTRLPPPVITTTVSDKEEEKEEEKTVNNLEKEQRLIQMLSSSWGQSKVLQQLSEWNASCLTLWLADHQLCLCLSCCPHTTPLHASP